MTNSNTGNIITQITINNMKDIKKFENYEEKIEISDYVKACLPQLKMVNKEISWNEVLDWFNDTE